MVSTRTSQLKRQISPQKTKSKGKEPPRVFSITSGKGGVGKTNIAGNLAVAFTELGKNVVIFDADLGLANIDIIFNVHPPYNISNVISGEKKLAEIMVEVTPGIRIIPAGSGFANLTYLTDGQKLNLLTEFDEIGDKIDIFIIDTGAGISSNVLYFNLAADDCILIATPEPTSITDAYAMTKVMSQQHNTKHFKLLVNMVENVEEAKKVYKNLVNAADKFLHDVVIEYLGYIPYDNSLKMSVRNRTPVMKMYPDSASSKSIKKIAGDLIKSARRFDSDGNIKFFFKRYIEERLSHGSNI
ncbi:MAG: MinD/ParA family protein [Desulfobacterales bacterium]|nr:MinD/ParA family protein [Desulfobacterales bacterium]MBF0396181.1 MinD/ParA family protein [Desulfobacterales bacterium]